jgi:hypothetical protein
VVNLGAGRTLNATPVAIIIDRSAPAILSFGVTTQPDFQDGGVGYYKAGAGSAVFSARLDGGPDPIDPASVAVSWASPDAGSPVPFDRGPLNAPPPYVFYVPRAAGIGLEGPQTFNLVLKNQAGNPTTAVATVQFDDQPPRFATQLSLPQPTAWVPRTASDGGFATQEIDVAVNDPGSGVQSVVATPDGGVAAALAPKAGGIFAGAISLSGAPAQIAGSYPVTIVAKDQLSNQSTATYLLQVDDVAPTVDAGFDSRWYGVSGMTSATPSVGISDVGSGVASATIFVAGGGSAAAALDGGTPSSGLWTATQAIALPTAARDTPLPLAVKAVDAVGNTITNAAGVTLNFDNVPPAVGSPTLVTPPDGTVGASAWYKGPSVAASNIEIAVPIVEPNLDASAANAPRITFTSYPGGVQTANSVPGVLQVDGLWHFVVPRLGGKNASGTGTPYTVVARDLAGNVSANGPQLTLYFDDAAAESFKPIVPADAAWYSRNAPASGFQQIQLGSSAPTRPVSGLRSIAILSGTTAVGTCDVNTGGCALDAKFAPAGAEGSWSFSVVATSNASITSTTSASRNIDDVPPAIDNTATIPYPAAAAGPLAWGHDGGHFTLRDSGNLFTFTAYDCGAGMSTSRRFSVGGSPGGTSLSVASAGAHSCANGQTAAVYSYTISLASGFGGASIGSYPGADNGVSVGIGLGDLAGGAANTSSSSRVVQVTRRLWSTNDAVAPGYNALGLGPSQVVVAAGSSGVFTLSRVAGGPPAQLYTANARFAVASNNGASPIAFLASSQALNAFDLGSGTVLRGCSLTTGVVLANSFVLQSMVLLDAATLLTSSRYEQVTSCFSCGDCGTRPCSVSNQCGGGCGGAVTQTMTNRVRMNSAGCTDVSATLPDLTSAALSANGNLLYLPTATSLAAVPVAGGTPSTIAIASASGFIAAAGGAGIDTVLFTDSVGTGLERYDFAANAFSSKWKSAGATGPLAQSSAGAGTIVASNTSGFQSLSFAGTNLGVALPGTLPNSLPPVLDGAAAPLAYLGNAGGTGAIAVRIADPIQGMGAVAPFALPVLPVAIDSVVLGSDGILFAAAGGRVYAMITDSTSGASAASWSGSAKDACRSNNLGYTCPY